MKRFLGFITLAAALLLPLSALAQATYTTQSGVTFFVQQAATATAASGIVRLPNFSGTGVLNIIETGITGSPSGCTVALKYVSNAGGAATAAVATVAFTPATGTQQIIVQPSVLVGDNYQATYACSSAYPTAGNLSISFSPSGTETQDPCLISPKSSVVVNLTGASATQLVALSTGKKVYVCGLAVGNTTAATTLTLNYGTGSACGTGTTALTGAVPMAANGLFTVGGFSTTFASTPVSNAVCATASAAGVAGILSYVQQ